MANPILPTNGTHELQERYATQIKALFRLKNNLRQFAGRDYVGNPLAGAVQVPVRDTEVAVGDYDVVAGGSLGSSATTYLPITVDLNKYINELIDGYEAQAVPDSLLAQRLDSGAYSMQRQMELDFIKEIRDNGTLASAEAALTSSNAYTKISAQIGEMLKLGIDPADMKVAITHDVESALLEDVKFTNTASQIGADRVMRGVIGMIRGVEVVPSNNLGARTSNGFDVQFMVFAKDWSQAGDEWMVPPTVEDLKDGVHIGASHLFGRYVQWNKLTDVKGARVVTLAA
jgi:hypothetical protein